MRMGMGKAMNEVMADDDLRMCCHVFGLILNTTSCIQYDC
jgi:hypothetical protein